MHWGIDLGGTKIEIIGLDAQSNECYRKRIASPQGDYAMTLHTLEQLILEAEQHCQTQGSVGIGIPGCIDPSSQRVKNANSTWLIGEALQADLETRLNRPIAIANDADCFTLSEATDGAGRNHACVFGVILGTGVGGGISIDQRVTTGPNSIRGEWGHNPLPWQTDDDDVADCYCGKRGCIETFLSGPGLLRQYASKTDHHARKLDRVEALIARAQDGDVQALACLQRYHQHLARALASVINVLDPDCIVLGGGLSNIPSLYTDIRAALNQYVFSDQCLTPIVPARYGDASGVRGAAWLGAKQQENSA
ncbi:MAG: ROK family protein [Oleiphilaceae bacterium]|nr:ROK family protein [Oleiphilaceae bacterium]